MAQPQQNPQAAMLLKWLTGQREHVLGALEGLSDADLRRPVLPSGWTCLGLVQHLALDVERFWFRNVMMGEPMDAAAAEANAWDVGPEMTASEVLALYTREIELADAAITRTDLDAAPAWWPDFFGSFRLENLREIMLHVIAETATHAGHLDAVRELIDGKTWLILTG